MEIEPYLFLKMGDAAETAPRLTLTLQGLFFLMPAKHKTEQTGNKK